jgi:exonuclease VII large subunit
MYEKHLADKEKHLDNKEKHLDDKEKHLANKEKHLDDKEKHLDNKEKHLDDKEKQLTDTEKQLADKKTQVEVLKQKFLPPVDVPNASEYYRRKENIDKSEIQAIQAIQALNHISVPTLSHNHALLDANEIKALLGDFYDPKRSAHLPIDKYNNELLLQRLSYMPEFRFNDNTRIKIQQSSGSLSIVSSSGSGKVCFQFF